MSPLLGGEFVVAFLALRIALWIWRSRHELGARVREDGPGGPGGGDRLVPRPRPALRAVSTPAPAVPLKRAA
jgi:hypothetical protein